MRYLTLLFLIFSIGCAGDSSDTNTVDPIPESFDPAEWFTFEAGPFMVPAGEERFFCYSHTLEEDLWTNELVLQSKPVVHHVVYSDAQNSDPDGFFECNALFQNNWVPIFVAGTGDASLVMPEGSGHILEKGTQLTMQLHLLNASGEDVNDSIPLHFRKMLEPPEQSVEVVVFGNTNIALPPAESEVVGDCASDSDMKIFKVFPHMHLLATRMIVETGPDEESLTEVFRRDPYDFDDQYLSDMDLEIKEGDRVRVTCEYYNPFDDVVTFGESSNDEMCFFIGFATGAKRQLSGCIGGGSAGDLLPEGCGEDPPNEIGLGATCSKGGGECQTGLLCTEDVEQTQGIEMCIGFGCKASSDCGEGGVCCGIEVAGDVTLCLPDACVFSFCEPVD
jgi:hypothetical protein